MLEKGRRSRGAGAGAPEQGCRSSGAGTGRQEYLFRQMAYSSHLTSTASKINGFY